MKAFLAGQPGRRSEPRDPETVASALRKRIYASLTGVATVMLLIIHVDDETARSSVISLVIAMTTLWLASLVSEVIAHGATSTDDDHRGPLRRIAFTAGQSLELLVVPVGLILLSLTGLWSLRTALILAIVALMATLAIASIYAVRRSTLGWFARALIVLVELGLGGMVILGKVLSH